MDKKVDIIIHRCRSLLDRYGAAVVNDPKISHRKLHVAQVGTLNEVGGVITVEIFPHRIQLNFADEFKSGSYPSLDALKKIEPMLDRMEEQIKAIHQYLTGSTESNSLCLPAQR